MIHRYTVKAKPLSTKWMASLHIIIIVVFVVIIVPNLLKLSTESKIPRAFLYRIIANQFMGRTSNFVFIFIWCCAAGVGYAIIAFNWYLKDLYAVMLLLKCAPKLPYHNVSAVKLVKWLFYCKECDCCSSQLSSLLDRIESNRIEREIIIREKRKAIDKHCVEDCFDSTFSSKK